MYLISYQGRRCVIKDCCIIEENAVLPPETVVASFTRYGSQGPVLSGDTVPEAMQELMIEYTKSYYEHFVPDRN